MAQNLPPEAGAPAPAAGAEQPGAQSGGKFAQALAEAHKAISLVAELAASDPAIAQKLAAAKAAVESVVEDGAGEQAPPQKGASPMPMEAGAAKVRPAL